MTASITRLADSTILPFDFGGVARTARRYVEEIQKSVQASDLDLREIHSQLTRLGAASKAYEDAAAIAMKRPSGIAAEKLAKVNEIIARAERALLLPDGLPGRPWYRHQLYAPGLYTGYGVKTLPGVREAVDAKRWDEANQQARRVAQALRAMCGQVEEATRLLKQAGE
jgi:N-acetylated-alpha-linked acidic dipeptidase